MISLDTLFAVVVFLNLALSFAIHRIHRKRIETLETQLAKLSEQVLATPVERHWIEDHQIYGCDSLN